MSGIYKLIEKYGDAHDQQFWQLLTSGATSREMQSWRDGAYSDDSGVAPSTYGPRCTVRSPQSQS